MENKVQFCEDEIEYIKENYPNVNLANLLAIPSNMNATRYLDILYALVKNDIEEKSIKAFDYNEYERALEKLTFEEKNDFSILLSIKNRLVHYMHSVDLDVPGVIENIEETCKEADKLSKKCVGVCIGMHIEIINQTISYLRSIEKYIDDEEKARISYVLGIKLGEILLRNNLRSKGFSWGKNKEFGEAPIIINADESIKINPIGIISEKLKINEMDDIVSNYLTNN